MFASTKEVAAWCGIGVDSLQAITPYLRCCPATVPGRGRVWDWHACVEAFLHVTLKRCGLRDEAAARVLSMAGPLCDGVPSAVYAALIGADQWLLFSLTPPHDGFLVAGKDLPQALQRHGIECYGDSADVPLAVAGALSLRGIVDHMRRSAPMLSFSLKPAASEDEYIKTTLAALNAP